MPRTAASALLALAVAAALAGCGGDRPAPHAATSSAPTPSRTASTAPSVTPSPQPSRTTAARPTGTANAVVTTVSPAEWARIRSTGTWRPGCPGGRATLRRVEVSYRGFDGRDHRGALVVNADVAASVARIFTRLYDEGFPIHRIVPIEAYRGDDNASMADDNTSAFNCRSAGQANAPVGASPHANGRAVDINPYENPWIDWRCHCWAPSSRWGRQRTGRGVVTARGVVVAAFRANGWVWRGTGSAPDLQHFDTGYPSAPFRG